MTDPLELEGWKFDNSYAQLPAALFTAARPVPVRQPGIVLLNRSLAAEIGLEADLLSGERGSAIFSGNAIPPGAEPIAQAYAGHQFGHFTNLGDGRAILLGEQITPGGQRVDIQLKGAGATAYSRRGDGRAALGPMLREFLISEAMHALGIPTTRSLAVVTTGERVRRETPLDGAILTRVAASHIRVGTFQYAAAVDDPSLVQALFDHAIKRHEPQLTGADDAVLRFLDAVMERQAALVARWMLVGFVHGVMNTDNMAISGESIDYGPCAFIDIYDPAMVFSSIDRQSRYAYGNQPTIAHWNLARLAESLLPLVPGTAEDAIEQFQGLVATFPERFQRHHLAGLKNKLGLFSVESGDADLAQGLLDWMLATRSDFTETFTELSLTAAAEPSSALPAGSDPQFDQWLSAWKARLGRQPQGALEVAGLMRQSNPVVIPRNHQVESALLAAQQGDLSRVHRLLEVLSTPFATTAANEPFRAGPPAGCGRYRTFCGT